jgi:S-formylglutathione hydrolase FrmB
LFVFMSVDGGPYPVTQCADTYDGVEKMDRFMGSTVPAYIDKHYRTIATPAARTLLGMSEGGYCAAILMLHHPDVFGSEISFSGYFTAGAAGGASKVPFGNNPTLISNDSPIDVAPQLDADVRAGLYVVLVAQRDQEFYGAQVDDYERVLAAAHIQYDFIDAEQPHGWNQVRDTFGPALTLVAEHQAELGVFGD